MGRQGRWRRHAVAGAAALALLGQACSSPASGPDGSAAPNLDAVRLGRAAYAEPGATLGSQVRDLATLVEVARLEPAASAANGAPDPSRAAAVEAIREQADLLADVVATDAPTGLLAQEDEDLTGDPVLVAAADAWRTALDAAEGAVESARSEADHLEALLALEEGLAAVTDGWEEPGSRSQQRARFAELVEEAQAHAAAAEALTDLPPCARAAEARSAAAVMVAERTAELRGHVDRGQGRAFDEARERFEADPWHDGIPGRDADDRTCWRTQSDVVRAGERAADALEELVDALNTGTGAPTED